MYLYLVGNLGRGPGEDPGHAGGTLSLGWPVNASGSPRKSWWKWPGRGKSGPPCLGCCLRDPTPGQVVDNDVDGKPWAVSMNTKWISWH